MKKILSLFAFKSLINKKQINNISPLIELLEDRSVPTIINFTGPTNINPSGSSDPNQFTQVDATLYFTANNTNNTRALYRYDSGTKASPVTLSSGAVNYINPGTVVDAGSRLYASAINPNSQQSGLFAVAAPKNTSFVVQNAPTGTYSDIVSFGLQAYFLSNNNQTGSNELYRTYDTYSNNTLTSITSTLVTGSTSVAPWTNPQKISISNGLLYIIDKSPGGNLGIFELGLSNNQTSGNASFSVTQIVGYNFSSILDLNIQNGNIFFQGTQSGNSGLSIFTIPQNSSAFTIPTALTQPVNASSGTLLPADPVGPMRFLNGQVFFAATGKVGGTELYQSNGITSKLALDINPNGNGLNPTMGLLNSVVVPNALILAADGGILTTTGSGTTAVTTFTPLGMEPASIPVSLDGVVGSLQVVDINPGVNGSNPTQFAANHYQAFFAANDPLYGNELFTTQGTVLTTFILKDFNVGNNASSNPKNMTVKNGVLYLSANNGQLGSELYVGSTYQTMNTVSISTQSPNNASLVNVGGTLFFVVGNDLWSSTGTLGSTLAVTTGSFLANYDPASLLSFNDALYFLKSNANGNKLLYYSKGVADSVPINVVMEIPLSSSSKIVGSFNNFLYINDSGSLYQIDSNGKQLLVASNYVDSIPSTSSVAGKSIVNANGTLFFAGKISQGNFSLYKLGPADTSAVVVGSILGNPGTAQPINFASIEGVVYFTALDGFTGNSLFKTTGVIDPVSGRSDITYVLSLNASTKISSFGNNIFFGSPTNALVGNEPWVSNGTLSGTKNIRNINTNSSGTAPSDPTVTGIVAGEQFAIFSAANQGLGTAASGLTNFEPYIITGFDSPIVTLLKDLNPGGADSSPADFTPVGNQIYFSADIGTLGATNRVLYSTQGTSSTTVPVQNQTGLPGSVDSIRDMEGNVAYRAIANGASTVWTSSVIPAAAPVQSIVRATPSTIRVDSPPTTSVIYNVRFNFDVDPTSVNSADFIIVKDSSLGLCTITNVVPVVNQGIIDSKNYLVTVKLPTKSGSFGKLSININPIAQIRAIAPGTPLVDLSIPCKLTEAFEINPRSPVVTSINRFNPTGQISSASSVVFKITFSQDILPSSIITLPPSNIKYQTSIDTANNNFKVSTTGTIIIGTQPVTQVEAILGSPNQFLVQVSGFSGDGTIQLQVANNATFISTTGLPYSQGGFKTGQYYTIDSVAPVLNSIVRFDPSAANTSSQVVTFQTAFSESLNPLTVTASGFVATGMPGAVIQLITFIPGTVIPNSTVNILVSVPLSNGILGLALSPNCPITDTAGTPINISSLPTVNETYQIFRQSPTVTSINRFNPSSEIATGSSVTFLVTFSQSMNPATVVPGSFNISTVGTSGLVTFVTPQSGNLSFEVTVGNLGGNGQLSLSIPINSSIQDSFGNTLVGGFNTGQIYTLNDNTSPFVISFNPQSSTVPNAALGLLSFNESVTGIVNISFTATTSTGQTIPVTLVNPPLSGQFLPSYSIQATGLVGSGQLTITFTNSGTISDQAGNTITTVPVGGVLATLTVPFNVPSAKPLVTTAGVPGTAAIVQINYPNGTFKQFTAFKNFMGGVRATTGDFNGDGTQDIVVAAGLGGNGNIRVFDGNTLLPIKNFFPYDYYQGGVSIATGDINNDGFDDIVSGVTGAYANASAMTPPHVVAFDAKTGRVLASFYAYGTGFLGGINVASGDVNNDGFAEIITTPSFGGPGHVKVFSINQTNGIATVLQSYLTSQASFTGGVWLAVADFNNDGFADIATGLNVGNPYVQINSGKNPSIVIDTIWPFNPQKPTGARVGAIISSQGISQLVIMPGYNSSPLVSIQQLTTLGFQEVSSFTAGFNSNNQGGIPG